MAHTYRGRTVPDCFINREGEMLAMWKENDPECMKCSVEAMCQEAQFELETGDLDDFGFRDDIGARRSSQARPAPRIVSAPTRPQQTVTKPVSPPGPIMPKGPRINELQLAIPRTRQVLPYKGEGLFERFGKNVILGGVTSTAFEAMLTFSTFEWKPQPVEEPQPKEESAEAKEVLSQIKSYLARREEEDRKQRENIDALRKIIEGK